MNGDRSTGSFIVLGTGFLYEYDASPRLLNVSRTGRNKPLLSLEFDRDMSGQAFRYTQIFEKTTQIKALRFSGNVTIDLGDTLDDTRLGPILQNSARLSHYAFNLENERFEIFGQSFCPESGLVRAGIVKTDNATNRCVYTAEAETERGNIVAGRSSSLHGALTYLSDKIMQDVVAREFGHGGDAWVHRLLNTATTLSTLALIMNEHFEPARKIGVALAAPADRNDGHKKNAW